MAKVRVCLVRYHDGTAKPNWGGRATSLGLGRLVHASGGTISATINGSYVRTGAGFDTPMIKARTQLRRVQARAGRRHPTYAPSEWSNIRLTVENALMSPRAALRPILESIRSSDEVWVNGEGDFILANRASLYRTLCMIHAADLLGRPIRLVNSILSDPVGARVPEVAEAVGDALGLCQDVTYRDPESLRFHNTLFPAIDAHWEPDALFQWSSEARAYAEAPAFGPTTELLPVDLQEIIASRQRYIALSGSSAIRPAAFDDAASDLIRFIGGARSRGETPVVVATDGADHWMLEVAYQERVPVVPAAVPLATGLTVLAKADRFISGRYHPSILAAMAGTACTFMGSNSHKTRSLQEILDASADPVVHPAWGEGIDVSGLLDADT